MKILLTVGSKIKILVAHYCSYKFLEKEKFETTTKRVMVFDY